MAVLSSLLCSPARFISPFRLRLWDFSPCKRRTWLFLSVQRCYTSFKLIRSSSQLGLERYKDLQKYFNRRLKAAYHRFSNIPDHSLVCGHNHVYFIEGDGIYRVDQRQSDPEPEQEKHLAATLKTTDTEEPRCVVVRLRKRNSPPPDPQHIVLTLDKVFSFEWATDDVLFYTTLEALRCSKVFRLDLTSKESRITSVFEETHPDVFVEVALSRDRQILSINGNSRSSSEVLLIDGTTSHLEPFLVQPRQPDLLYHVEHWRESLVILANTGPGQEYQVLQSPLSKPSMASWVPLFTPDSGTVIKDMDVIGDHCVLVARSAAGGLVLIVVSLTNPKEAYTVQLPSWACAIQTKKPGMADRGSVLEFLISSPVHTPVPYSLSPEDGLLLSGSKDGSSPGAQGRITTTRLEACNQDGTLVPVTLFHSYLWGV
ncbi:Prolyl endopeptidase-like [Dissostichus eleginoides]|uniref:Prolyl endopeptidase-like n=1 Tax=Dissostichus eleginoides TaxID=100907 RepID=A0AAD9CS61_DISEL|nr:Prolyl endopeptidase-like [Dissostichus eleginoides]